MTDFNSEAAAHRGRQLYAARLKATGKVVEILVDAIKESIRRPVGNLLTTQSEASK